MPSFKPKPVKKIQPVGKNTITLDNHHTEILDTIENNDNVVIPNLEKEKKHYKRLLKKNISIEEAQQDEFKSISPFSKIPVLVCPDGQTIFETVAIALASLSRCDTLI